MNRAWSALGTVIALNDHPGLLLVAHGTRDPKGLSEASTLCDLVRQQLPDLMVELAYLELAEPGIPQAVEKCRVAGIRRLGLFPLLLLAAGHAKRDIPAAVAEAARRFPEMTFDLAPHFGLHPGVVQLSLLRYRTSLEGRSIMPDDRSLLILVGRGSSDPENPFEFSQFARLRARQQPNLTIETCFVAMAEPRLEDTLRRAAASPALRVVVQPHLLFSGQLLTQLQHQVEACQKESSQEWVMTDHLGPHPLLAQAIDELQADLGARRRTVL